MQKLICSGCGAGIVPNTTQQFLVCEYCDTTVPNPYYCEEDAKAAAVVPLDELCVQILLEMGEGEKLDDKCFGKPILQSWAARMGMGIPDGEKMYLLYEHQTILGTLRDGFALTQGGLYYRHDGESGSRSWESFITAPVACKDRTAGQDGTLTIGASLSFAVSSEKDSRMARFLIDFHNRVYHAHTGQPAPEAWTASESDDVQATDAQGGSLAGTVLTAARTLLAGAAVRSAVSRSTSAVRRTAPAVQPRPEPPRHAMPHVQSARIPRPAARPHADPRPRVEPRLGTQRTTPNVRPGMSRPDAGGPGMGRSGGAGKSFGPGRRGPGGSGGPGRGRR